MNYYIRGNKKNADKIKAAFEEKGCSVAYADFSNDRLLFFTTKHKNGEVHVVHIGIEYDFANTIKNLPNYTELGLPIEPKFKVGDWIKNCVQQRKIGKVYEKQQVYLLDNGIELEFSEQDQWEVVEPQAKFGEGQLVVYNGLIGKVKYFQYFKAEGCYRYVIGDDVIADEDQLTLADHRDIARITGKG